MRVGVLGGGQLGRMLALAGVPLGLEFRFLDPSQAAPMAAVADQIVGDYSDLSALGKLCSGADIATFEFENVPSSTAAWIADRVQLYPSTGALLIAQDRLFEKQLFVELGIPCAQFAQVDCSRDLLVGIEKLGLPCILKTRRMGYDGKGQLVLRDRSPFEWPGGDANGHILESMVHFDRELSLLAVRSANSEIRCYPLIENLHRDGILRLSLAPAPRIGAELQYRAETYAKRLLERLDYVGVLAVELFERDGELLANEIAPRVHNSGHWSIEGASTSQFENHLRAILGFPLGDTAIKGSVAMVNLVGDIPDRSRVLAMPGAHLHLYGKQPRVGRKVGHITVCAESESDRDLALARLVDLLPERRI